MVAHHEDRAAPGAARAKADPRRHGALAPAAHLPPHALIAPAAPQMSRKMADRSLVAVAHTGNLTYEQSALLKREARGVRLSDVGSRLPPPPHSCAPAAQVQSAGGSIHVVKNSLLGLGMRNAGLDALVPLLRGKVAVAVGDDEASRAVQCTAPSRRAAHT